MSILHLAKLKFSKKPKYLCDLLRLSDSSASRNNRIFIAKFSRSCHMNNFCYQTPKIWNALCLSPSHCNEISTAPTLQSLKKRLKSMFLKMQTYGTITEWTTKNHNIHEYITAIKLEPCETMN